MFGTPLMERLRAISTEISVPDGAMLFAPGDASEQYLLPLTGRVRVEQVGASGRTVVLYRLAPGDGCVMTTTALLSGRPYSAWGYAEGDVTALALGANAFHQLLSDDSDFRAAVLAVFSDRLVELTEVIDDLLFARMDLRLARWLAEHAGPDTARIDATHEKVAAEMGSAREVISRLLKDFERRGWIRLSRGAVEVLEPDALVRHAGSL